jgi:hypothetical protein
LPCPRWRQGGLPAACPLPPRPTTRGPVRLIRKLVYTTDRRLHSAGSTPRAAPSCEPGPAPALGQMPERPQPSRTCRPRQLPMTPAATPKTRDSASRRRQSLVVHALAPTTARNTIPCIAQSPTRNTHAPDSGLGQLNDS